MKRLETEKRITALVSTSVLILAIFAVATPINPAMAKSTLVVDDDGAGSRNDCDAPDAAFSNISDAVVAASSGDTILVCPGTYDEQVVVDKDKITIDGSGIGSTIIKPSSVAANSVSLTSGASIAAIILVDGVDDVVVRELTVDGTDGAFNACSPGYMGIYYRNADGRIDYTNVTGIFHPGAPGCQAVLGIFVQSGDRGTSDVTIENSMVSDYGKNGITCNEIGTTCKVINNSVIGRDKVGQGNAAQNGIQIGFGATGMVKDNDVDSNWFTGADWTASGILVFESNNVNVLKNTVLDSQSGIVVEAWCFGLPTAENNKIHTNTIGGDSDFGISVAAFVLGFGISSCDPSADNNKVVNNSVSSDSSGDTGIFVGTGFAFGGESSGLTPAADNNKVIRNTVAGYTTAIDDQGTDTKIHANPTS